MVNPGRVFAPAPLSSLDGRRFSLVRVEGLSIDPEIETRLRGLGESGDKEV